MTKGDETLTPGALVRHPRFGSGVVELDKGATTIVRFDRGLEECERGALEVRLSLEQAIAQRRWSGRSGGGDEACRSRLLMRG